ncbi:MAG: ABC transporter ATP-binding protein [Chloroflexota bacterium]|nr:ABC transporter ATP-binding protein [Chloroflexota bacterium]
MATHDPQLDTHHSSLVTPEIAFERVTKRFPSAATPAVDEVSLEVQRGELVVLLGPSGCGKTTLLKLVNRLYEHDAGRILVEGREISTFKATDLRRRIGYVIQSVGLFPHMTVARNIATVPEMLGWDKARINSRVDELLELVGMMPERYRKRYPAQLSGGEQQRVGIARAMAADPAIMLMDEPFAAIDSITRRRLQDELLSIQQKVRKTILFVTHDVEEAIRLADRIAVMRAGKVLQYDTPLRILSAPTDEFVAQLTGAGDVLRRLSLLDVVSVMHPSNGVGPSLEKGPTVRTQDSVRDALGLLLGSGAETLAVVDEQDQRVGSIDMAGIRRVTHPA